ncbi:zona pellucida sperm-binding protein 4-like [Caretta caretta]|uniref:zona pellucida sperm-binding protein 4-like n=1 Tax=Caretta caretta TaxID=8467 RepID=UPI002094E4BC|nr:zona pellucida sperm-binding protein 4-like [Caretta caretta]
MGVIKQQGTSWGNLVWIFCSCLSLAWGAPNVFKDAVLVWDHSLLDCGWKSLQLTLPENHPEMISLLSALDLEGLPHPLSNSTCGVLISQKQDGSMIVTAPYAGCFFIKKNGYFLMTIRIKGIDDTGEVSFHEEELRCPIHLPALDAPSTSVCTAVLHPDRLPCATPPVSQEECEGKGCCYSLGDPVAPCYYGNTVTAQCTTDGQFSIAVSRDVTLPPLILDSVHLVSGHGSSCIPVAKSNAFVLYRFPLSACGTTFQGAGDQGVYENQLVADRDVRSWSTGSITRDSTFRLHVSCSYSTGDFLPLNVQVFTLPPPPPVTQYGPLTLELRIATDQQYSRYYVNSDYPVIKLLRDPVYMEVRILQRTDPNLALVLHQCWATPSTNPMQQPQWPILVDGCPYTGDNYQTKLIPVGAASGLQFPSHYQRFIINTFTFVDLASQKALSGPVYFHCSASACVPSAMESCKTLCTMTRARRAPEKQASENAPRYLVTTEGPVDFQNTEVDQTLEQKGSQWTRDLLSQEWEQMMMVAVGAGAIALVFVGVKYWQRQTLKQKNITSE